FRRYSEPFRPQDRPQKPKNVMQITYDGALSSYVPDNEMHAFGRREAMTWSSDRTGVLLYTILGTLLVMSWIYVPALGARRAEIRHARNDSEAGALLNDRKGAADGKSGSGCVFQLKLFLPRRPRCSRRCHGRVIPNVSTLFRLCSAKPLPTVRRHRPCQGPRKMQIRDVTSVPSSPDTTLSFGWALCRHFRELDRSKRLHWAGHDSK